MRSMTGFGRGAASDNNLGIRVSVELIAVNRKQLDIRISLPRELPSYEPMLRKLISAKLSRGSINAKVNLEISPDSNLANVKINRKLAVDLAAQCVEFQKELNLTGEIRLVDILNIPGVVEAQTLDLMTPEMEKTIGDATKQALDQMIKMREEEGVHIREDLEARVNTLSDLTDKIEPFASEIPELQKRRLLDRLGDSGLEIDPSDDRILREIVIFTDKADISEELSRLRGHCIQFKNYLTKKIAIGRSLEFITQEMLREITTLGNKSPHPEISPKIVELKTELEKIREQCQNVE